MKCLGDEELAALALGEPGAAGVDHLAGCAACAARLSQIEGILRLGENAHRVPELSLPVLDAEPKPTLPSTLEKFLMDRRTWAVAVLAAIVLLYLPLMATPLALAEVLKTFKNAEAFVCEAVVLQDGKPVDKDKGVALRLAWSTPGSIRQEMLVEGKAALTTVFPHGKPGIVIDHKAKTYTRTSKLSMPESVLLRMVRGLAGDLTGDAKPAGHDIIGDLRAERFDLKAEADGLTCYYRLWADPETRRPVRIETAFEPGQKPEWKGNVLRLEGFDWGAKAVGSFDTTAPVGYKDAPIKENVADLSAKKIAEALKKYLAALGHYPRTEPFDPVAAAKDMGKKADAKTVEGLVLLGVIQVTAKEASYRGKSVGPEDKGKVLFRWKAEDNKYRVLFGDLRTDALTAEQLKELEK